MLIQWWLLKCPNTDKVRINHTVTTNIFLTLEKLRVKFQLYKDKKTIGDLDFLFHDTETDGKSNIFVL